MQRQMSHLLQTAASPGGAAGPAHSHKTRTRKQPKPARGMLARPLRMQAYAMSASGHLAPSAFTGDNAQNKPAYAVYYQVLPTAYVRSHGVGLLSGVNMVKAFPACPCLPTPATHLSSLECGGCLQLLCKVLKALVLAGCLQAAHTPNHHKA